MKSVRERMAVCVMLLSVVLCVVVDVAYAENYDCWVDPDGHQDCLYLGNVQCWLQAQQGSGFTSCTNCSDNGVMQAATCILVEYSATCSVNGSKNYNCGSRQLGSCWMDPTTQLWWCVNGVTNGTCSVVVSGTSCI